VIFALHLPNLTDKNTLAYFAEASTTKKNLSSSVELARVFFSYLNEKCQLRLIAKSQGEAM
jgi:hypothetical protein